MNKKILFAFLLLFFSEGMYSQLILRDTFDSPYRFQYQQPIIPVTFLTYGIIGLKNHVIDDIDLMIYEEIHKYKETRTTFDDFAQYSPMVAVYSLNALGVKGQHNFKDRTIILATAYTIIGATVLTTKHASMVVRPDGSSDNSFPSGHTATAFMGAEFLYQEYKHESSWYGVGGYAIAAGVGALRIIKDRHWFSDVVAGAGVGILGTKIAYWVYPYMMKLFNQSDKIDGPKVMISPQYNGKTLGGAMVMTF